MKSPSIPRVIALSFAFAACLAGSAAVQAQTQTLKADDFTNATGSGATVTNAPGTYTSAGNTSLSVQNDNVAGGINSGNALLSSNAGAFSKLYTSFGAVTLMPNQTIQLSFDLRYTTQPNNGFGQLRFGLYDQNGVINNDTEPDPGYLIQTNPGASSTGGSRFYSEKGINGTTLGGDNTDVRELGTAGFGAINFGTSPVNVIFSITRTDTGLAFNSTIGSVVSPTVSLASTDDRYVGATFDSFFIGEGNSTTNTPFLLDNVNITAVPEPTTVAGALLLAGFLGYRERRRFREMWTAVSGA